MNTEPTTKKENMRTNQPTEMRGEFIKLSEPLIKWLDENYHPHHQILITPTSAELSEGQMAHRTMKYIKD